MTEKKRKELQKNSKVEEKRRDESINKKKSTQALLTVAGAIKIDLLVLM